MPELRNAASTLEPILVGRREATRILGGISLRSLDHAVASGLLKPRRLGRRVMFTVTELQRFASRDHVRIVPEATEK